MAFHRRHRHFQYLPDLRRVQVFLISQNHYHPRRLWQRGDQPAERFAEHRVAHRRFRHRLGYVRQRHLRTPPPATPGIDGALYGHFPQPVAGMRRRLNAFQIPVQAQEDFLRHIFGLIAIVQKVPADTEDHRLVLAHQLAEVQTGLPCAFQFDQCASVT